MKTLSCAVTILLLSSAVPVRAASVYSGCASPTSTFRHVWYFDPVHGKTQAAGGNGSQSAPWNSLQALIQGGGGYAFPLLTTGPYRWVPVAGKAAVVATGPKAGPVAPGDEILLMSGNYGDIWLNVNGVEISNSDFITIQAAPGQTPVLTSLFVAGTNKWVFNGLKVQSLQSAARSGNALVEIKDGGAAFPTSNIVFENMSISSQDNVQAWSQGQWVANARNGFWAQSTRRAALNTNCISFTGSHISNVRMGAGLLASQLLFSNNQIDHFGDDGIDYGASNLAITHNNLHDNLNVGDNNHEDGMQGVAGILAPGSSVNHYQNILIELEPGHPADGSRAFLSHLSAGDRRLRRGLDEHDGDQQRRRDQLLLFVWPGEPPQQPDRQQYRIGRRPGPVPGCTASTIVGGKTHEGSDSSNVRVTNNLGEHFVIEDQNEPTVTFDHNVALNSYQPFVHWNGKGWTYSYPSGTDAKGNKAFATAQPYAAQFPHGILRP